MRVLITSGGTVSHIDDVRVITNISTGKLGSVIAEKFASSGMSVTYLAPKNAVRPLTYNIKQVEASSVEEELVPLHDVVIHAMAISDFGFQRKKSVKLKSDSPDAFIEYLRENIIVNPKVLSCIKKWNPKCFLVSFKFEVGQTPKQLIGIALKSLKKNSSDLVVANDKVEMEQNKAHIAYLISPDKSFVKVSSKEAIAEGLIKVLEKIKC
jgi:phosphopantothenate--cysteine ligase